MHVRTRRVAFATLAASSLLLMTACDSGSASGSGSGSGPGSGSGAGGKKGKGTPSAPAYITANQAEQALVALDDLPAGWKLEPNTGLDKSQGASDDMVSGVKAECAPVTAVLNTGRLDEDHKANAQAVFVKKGDQTTIAQDVSGYPLTQAEKAMTGLRTAVGQCASVSATQGGKKATLKVKKAAEQPQFGDESIAYSVTVVQGGMQMDFDFATVRSHGAVTTVLNNYSDHGDRGKEAFSKALAEAAQKLVAAAAKTV
ncbi:hypothetical protein AB0F13_13910 [Streptomyces sp. NPDC026206]|uniref:hypothetical protein n=1 Tax=Streptomyces sp. NPDC026206 TaxID=3157089 RepID=UPI0034044D5B